MALICADTTFLIDLSRELGRSSGPVHDFLREHQADGFAISVTVLGEFAVGFAGLQDKVFLGLKSRFRLLNMGEEDVWHYREIFRHLKSQGRLIGANDLWIAASALRYDAALVTRNAQDFNRVPGLKVLFY